MLDNHHDIPLKHLQRWENSLLRLQALLERAEQIGHSTNFSALPALLDEQAQLGAGMEVYHRWISLIEEQTPTLSEHYHHKKKQLLLLVAQLEQQTSTLAQLFSGRKTELQVLLAHPITPRRPASALKVAQISGRVDLAL